MSKSEFYGADELRESWFLLIVVADDSEANSGLIGWGTGIGNAQQLLETNQQLGTTTETELIASLGERLDDRRYQDLILITPAKQTLNFLRGRILDIEEFPRLTFRGYRHLGIQDLFKEYIDLSAANNSAASFCDQPIQSISADQEMIDLESMIEDLWQLRIALGPILPADALRGQPV